jgi:hypothetical protein
MAGMAHLIQFLLEELMTVHPVALGCALSLTEIYFDMHLIPYHPQ